MITIKDQMNFTIRLGASPRRIVSLVPSQTQLLHHLELEDEVVGITKFCIQPDVWFRSKTRVGGTKSIDIEKVKALKPDLIIGNKEENSIEDIEALKAIAPVWMSDIYTLDDSLRMIGSISEVTDKQEIGNDLIDRITNEFNALEQYLEGVGIKGKTVLYYIWKEPYMVSGKNTFVDEMLSKCGLTNATNIERYPEVDAADYQPDFVFLSSEPFPFKEEHIADFQLKFPNSKIVLVDGEMFSWYGSKLEVVPLYFKKLIESIGFNHEH
ncbi:MAG: ABC-type Fe3+-hydroxamate transport system substrate-binding protein [Crocinitomicaceae bacterium]|jgi:ABC-type Fe3+-hydroxamate transport system substrate-binding protein